MTSLIQRLLDRKLVQWAIAYLAGAWLALQVLDLLGGFFEWPAMVGRVATVLLGVGFLGTLVAAWFHGERGEQRLRGIELAMFAVLCVMAAAGVAFVGGGRHAPPPAPDPAVTGEGTGAEQGSIAVLPFADMSPGKDQEYFSDGITEEILNRLAQVPGLRVAARTSSFAFKGKHLPMEQIGRELKVAHVLEGSIQRLGDRVRITAQLISARDGYHLWSQRFDREATDIFAIEDEISRAIVEALRVKLSPGTVSPRAPATPLDPETHALFLRARYHQNRYTEADLRKALALYDSVIARQPDFAEVHARVANTWAWLADDWISPREASRRGLPAIERALALDSLLDAAHEMRAGLAFGYEYDYPAAEAWARRALELNPNNPEAYVDLGFLLSLQERWPEVDAALERAALLDPLSVSNLEWAARVYLGQRRYDKVIGFAQRALQIDPNSLFAMRFLGDAHLAQGNAEEALAIYRRGLALDSTFVRLRNAEARALVALGRVAEARAIARGLEQEARRRYVRGEEIAGIYAALGDRDRAFHWLEQAYRDRSAGLNFLKHYPMYDPLKSDPRWPALLRKAGLE